MSGYKATVRQPPMFGVLDVGDDLQELTGEEVRVYREEEARELEARANAKPQVSAEGATEGERARRWLNAHGLLTTSHGRPPCPRWSAKFILPTPDGHVVSATESLGGYGTEEKLLVDLQRIVEAKHFSPPDFDAMEDDEVRAWLRERGRRVCEDTRCDTTYRLEGKGLERRPPVEVWLTEADDSRGWRALARKVWEREQS